MASSGALTLPSHQKKKVLHVKQSEEENYCDRWIQPHTGYITYI